MKERLDFIDIAKGIGIFLVVLGHSIVPRIRESFPAAKFLWIFIYNFHMPLFFFLSGWLFERGLAGYTGKGRFILNKFKFLMVPYFVFSIFAYVLVSALSQIAPLAHVLQSSGYYAVGFKEAIVQILTYSNHMDQHLWFVFSLFIVFALNILFPKAAKSKIMLLVFLALYVSKRYIHYYGILDFTASDLFFFSLARALYGKRNVILRSPPAILAAAAVFVTSNCIHCFFYLTDMPPGFFGAAVYLIRCACSVSGILLVCTLSDYLSKKTASEPLKTMGLYSYDIYLMHTPFLVAGLMGLLMAYTKLPLLLSCAAAIAAGIILPYTASKFIIRKIPFLSVLLLGKNYGKSAAQNGTKNLQTRA